MRQKEYLLETKIKQPTNDVEIIDRQRLIDKFSGYVNKKLTVVSAPTGYGKTVLLTQFALKEEVIAWYQLDKFDNDISIFIKYVIKSISESIPQFGMETLAFINQENNLSSSIHTLVVLLVSELEARAKDGLIVIIDDYHLITESLIHEVMGELIMHLPKNVHIVISSRYKLPINYTRLKAHGLVNEITLSDLRFRKEEISELFYQREDLEITDTVIDRVEKETDGWAVALFLFRVSDYIKNGQKINLLYTKGSNREEVYRYLLEEVFSGLTDVLQNFLVNTSILETLTPAICNELAGINSSEDVLKELLNTNIFISKIKGFKNAYRYHHLFKDFLLEHLGERRVVLSEKAGKYFVRCHNYNEAVEYFILAKNYKEAALIMEDVGLKTLKSGEWQTVKRWISSIPKEFVNVSSKLMLLQGVLYNYEGLWEEALLKLEQVIYILSRDDIFDDLILAQFEKAVVLRRTAKIDESLGLLKKIISKVNNRPIKSWYEILLERINSLLWIGSLGVAIKELKIAVEQSKEEGEHELTAYFMEHLGATYYVTGDYYLAIEYYNRSNKEYLKLNRSLTEIERERYSQRTTLGRIYRDWGELGTACELIQEEIEIKERLGLVDDLPRAYHQLAVVNNDLGKIEEAGKFFEKADDLYQELGRIDFQWTWHLAIYGKYLIDNGDSYKGKRLLDRALEEAKDNSSFNLAVCELISAFVSIRAYDINTAIHLTGHALEVGLKIGAKYLVCQCYWILAIININLSKMEKAIAYTKDCFELASEGNYLQIFLAAESASIPLVNLANKVNVKKDFVIRLTSKFSEVSKEIIAKSEEKFVKERENISVITVKCFGGFQAYNTIKDTVIEWQTTKSKELFAYFINCGNQHINKEVIMEIFWPEMNPEKTSVKLHSYIYQIRKVLKSVGIEKGLTYKNKCYCLNLDYISSDLAEFKKLTSKDSEKNIDERIAELEKAVLLHQGEFLSDMYSQWIVDERQNLERLYVNALLTLANLYWEKQFYDDAIKHLLTITIINSLHEEAHENIMKCYEKLGNRISAISHYEKFYELIMKEMNLEPNDEMKRIYERILNELG